MKGVEFRRVTLRTALISLGCLILLASCSTVPPPEHGGVQDQTSMLAQRLDQLNQQLTSLSAQEQTNVAAIASVREQIASIQQNIVGIRQKTDVICPKNQSGVMVLMHCSNTE
jgi:uncharacterized membrane protein YgcG